MRGKDVRDEVRAASGGEQITESSTGKTMAFMPVRRDSNGVGMEEGPDLTSLLT